jgi:ankyrin repeat protein
MFNQPPNKENTQKKLIKFLIEKGANVNHIDKGGFSAIDFVAANRHPDLVALLLENNADILHMNKIFVAKRRNILEYVSDAKTRNILSARLALLEAKMKAEKDQAELERKMAGQI